MDNKPGYRTTEFWFALAVLVASTVGLVTGDLTGVEWGIANGLSSLGYSGSRGLVKFNNEGR